MGPPLAREPAVPRKRPVPMTPPILDANELGDQTTDTKVELT